MQRSEIVFTTWNALAAATTTNKLTKQQIETMVFIKNSNNYNYIYRGHAEENF